MSRPNFVVSYDEKFVQQSIDYGRTVNDLREARNELNRTYQNLAYDRQQLILDNMPTDTVAAKIRAVMAEIREVTEKIDEALATQMSHLNTCEHRHRTRS